MVRNMGRREKKRKEGERKVGRREKEKRGWLGWAGREKRGREEGFGFLFFKLLFKLLKFKVFSKI
jgi:hypothetical protein